MEKNKKSSLQKNDTWAIRGIEQETRTAATMAARRAGQTVGEWCNRALREAATEGLKEKTPAPRLEDTLTRLAESLEQQAAAQRETTVALTSRLEAIERQQQKPPPEPLGSPQTRFRWLGALLGRKQP